MPLGIGLATAGTFAPAASILAPQAALDADAPAGDMGRARAQHGAQTVDVPAGGGAVLEVKIDEPGMYPFVSHAFSHVDLGQVGLLKVGNPKGTSTH